MEKAREKENTFSENAWEGKSWQKGWEVGRGERGGEMREVERGA